jgi:hypothetical protein
MSDPVSPARARGRRNLVILAALFLLPVIAAFALYFGGIWRPQASSARGELIQPPRTLEMPALRHADGTSAGDAVLRGKWSLVYIGDGRCDAACRTALTYGRQSRLALNKDMQRVQRVFLSTAQCCDQQYLKAEQPGLVVLDASTAEGRQLLAQFPDNRRASLFIVDPLGNLMMRHDASQLIDKALLTDLKKLLKLSQIG